MNEIKLTKRQIQKVVTQCKKELKDRFIDADVFDYEVVTDEVIYETEIMTLAIYATFKDELYYEFNEVYIDEDFNCLQWHLVLH